MNSKNNHLLPSEKFYLMYDTSFKSSYCYIFNNKKSLKELENTWDKVITLTLDKVPNFEDDFFYIETPINAIELLDIKPQPKDLSLYKEKLNNLIAQKIENNRFILSMDALIDEIFQYIFNENEKQISINSIISKIEKLPESKQFHTYASVILDIINKYKEELIKFGKNSRFFQELILSLTWIDLIRFMRQNKPEDTDVKYRLKDWYLNNKNNYGLKNLQAASIFIDPIHFKNNKEYLDQEFIEFLFTGYFYLEKRKPIMLVSCDKNKIDERLKDYLKNYLFISEELRPKLHPGKLILVPKKPENLKDSNDINVIDISEYIKKHTHNNIIDNL